MGKIVTKFSNFLNESLNRDHIISNEDANLLFELEEGNKLVYSIDVKSINK